MNGKKRKKSHFFSPFTSKLFSVHLRVFSYIRFAKPRIGYRLPATYPVLKAAWRL